MPIEALVNVNGSTVEEDRIQQFRNGFRGEIIRPGDAQYEDARKIWNAGAAKRPGVIARCSGVADVVAAVNFGRENDVLVAVRGGGHNVGGRALCDGGLVIDLSRMTSVHVDPSTRTVRVQGGARLGDLDHETHAFGLAVPAGVVSKHNDIIVCACHCCGADSLVCRLDTCVETLARGVALLGHSISCGPSGMPMRSL